MGCTISTTSTDTLRLSSFNPMDWVPFCGETFQNTKTLALSGAAIASAILCIKWLQLKHSDDRGLDRRLKSKLAVFISGCDSGLGYSLAVHCHNQLGLTVFAGCLRSDSEGALNLKELLSNNMHIVPLNITNTESVNAARDLVKECINTEHLELTALVNNAGVMVFGEFDWQTERLMRHQVEVNLLGTMRITKAFIALLRVHQGRVITVSSHCALQTLPGLAVYGATKTALRAWSDGLRLELAKFGMHVVTLIPGSFFVKSNILAYQRQYGQEMLEAMSETDRELYRKYFDCYQSYLNPISTERGAIELKDEKLYGKFDHALLATKPHAYYIVSPLRYRIYHTLVKLAPTISMRDWLIQKFVQMPEWIPPSE